MLRVSGILAVLFAMVLSGCRGSLFYPVGWPDHSGFELLERRDDVRIFAEQRHLSSGLWGPLLSQIDEHSRDVLSLFSLDEAKIVDLYLHASCEVDSEECMTLSAATSDSRVIDMWFGEHVLDDVPRQLDTFRHEYTHAIVRQQGHACPRRIFSEGTAEWARLTTQAHQEDLEPEVVVLDALAERAESDDGWIALTDLVNSADHVQLARDNHARLSYLESAAFTWYLVDDGGLDKFMRFRKDACLLGEASLRDMLEDRYGTNLEAIDRALLAAVESRW